MKRRTLKNKVYRLPKTDIKPIKVDTSKMEELKPVEKIKYVKGNFRENVPPLELAWLKLKRSIIGAGKSAVKLAIKTGIKELVAKFLWIALIILGIIVALKLL